MRSLPLTWLLLVLICLFLHNASAQQDVSGLEFDLSVRYRYEQWHGMNAKNYGDDGPDAVGKLDDKILYQRLIFGLTFTKPALRVGLHIQDSRAFGWSLRHSQYPDLFKQRDSGTAQAYYIMNPNEEFFDIYDAYIAYDQLFNHFSIVVGRQKIYYGDSRIFGPGEWGNTGRWTWDAVRLSYRKDENFIDVFAGGTKIHDPDEMAVPFSKTEFWGGGIYAHQTITPSWSAEPFYAYKKEGSAPYIRNLDIDRNWAGVRIFSDYPNGLLLDGTIAKQFGSEHGKRIAAYGAVLKAGYQFVSTNCKPALSIRRTYASGGTGSDAIVRKFEPAYGASDKYYGWMNIASWSNFDMREILLELHPVNNMSLELTYLRYFIPVPEGAKILGTMVLEEGEKHFGDEFNIFFRARIHRHWQIVAATGIFWPGKLKDINGHKAPTSKWMAFQLFFEI